jgi:threonine synthase
MRLLCTACERIHTLDPLRFRCDCGGTLEIQDAPTFEPARVDRQNLTLWRYRHALPLPERGAEVTLGEGMTPLLATEWDGLPVLVKCEFLNPTGSFKDRGTTVLATALAATGVDEVVEDSSGNAGSSLAAYAARAGIRATVYVPGHASPVKRAQIAAYGARVVPVPGPRTEAARAVLEAARRGAAYASHVYHPLIHQGMKTIAFEIHEQLQSGALGTGRMADLEARPGPDAVVLPVGHGTLLLGLARGFAELQAAGCVERLPRLFGVQATRCAPLASAWAQGAEDALQVTEGETVAEGVRIATPVRGRAVLAAVRGSGGAIVSVADDDALAAQRKLAHQGFYVEPTSALAAAALSLLREQLAGSVALILTGSGFKSPAGG